MTNARLFGNIVNKFIKPVFQSELKYYNIEECSNRTDVFLTDLFAHAFRRSDIKYIFYYLNHKSKPHGSNKVLELMNINNIYYNYEEKKINIYFAKDFSIFYFEKMNHLWDDYLNEFKKFIQHEMVHYYDFSKIPDYVIKNSNLGTVFEIENLNENQDRRIQNIYNNVLDFMSVLHENDYIFYNYLELLQNDPLAAQIILVNIFKRYKQKKDFELFKDLFSEVFYAMFYHDFNPKEIRAIAEEVIIDFFNSGLNKLEILEIVKKDIPKTVSERYNSLMDLLGASNEFMNKMRYEIANQVTQLIEISEIKHKLHNRIKH